MAQAARGYAWLAPQPAVDVADVQPRLLRIVNAIGAALKHVITITSGYRTPAQSAALGESASDPHTRGIAVDATIAGVPIARYPGAAALIRRYGLVSGDQPGYDPTKPGGYDPVHVQLATRSSTTAAGTSSSTGPFGFFELQKLWTQAGGSKAWAPIMAAVALAESSGDPRAHALTKQEDSRGLWQINVLAHPRYASVNLYDPVTNARAAVAVFRSSGAGAWATYTSGAYLNYLTGGSTGGSTTTAPRTRPGGEGAAADDSNAQDIGFTIPGLGDLGNDPFTGLWNRITGPWHGLKDVAHATMSFVNLLGWLFSPKHWIMLAEVVVGVVLLFVSVVTLILVFVQRDDVPGGKLVEKTATRALGPLGKPMRTAARTRARRPASRVRGSATA